MHFARTIRPGVLETAGFVTLPENPIEGEEWNYEHVLESFSRVKIDALSPVFVKGRTLTTNRRVTFVFEPDSGKVWVKEGHFDLDTHPFWCLDITVLAMAAGFQAIKFQIPRLSSEAS